MLRPIHSGKERSVVFPIHASDVEHRDLLRAFHLACFRIAAVAESLSIHLCHHSYDTLSCLDFALGEYKARCTILAAVNRAALEFLQVATQAPQPIQAAASKAASAVA